jgi:alanine racemase
MVRALEKCGYKAPLTHVACTAAALIFPETRRELVRIGIGLYGLWPSRETLISIRERNLGIQLRPVASWKTRVAQVKVIRAGSYVGYGCAYRAKSKTRLAVLPVGYYDGLARSLNSAHVLIRGHRAPIRGRICMNLCMVDVTDIRGVGLEDEVVLIGTQGKDRITTEQLAGWIGTINYEVISRINPVLPRVVI